MTKTLKLTEEEIRLVEHLLKTTKYNYDSTEETAKEILDKITKSNASTKKPLALKEFVYNFVGGGWNTEWAKTKRGAIAQAKKRWLKEDSSLMVNERSFRVAYKNEVSGLMQLND